MPQGSCPPMTGFGVDRQPADRRAARFRPPVLVQVAAAHARGLHLDDDLARPRGRVGKLHQLDFALAAEHHAAHRFLRNIEGPGRAYALFAPGGTDRRRCSAPELSTRQMLVFGCNDMVHQHGFVGWVERIAKPIATVAADGFRCEAGQEIPDWLDRRCASPAGAGSSRRPLRGLLRMRNFLNAINGVPSS